MMNLETTEPKLEAAGKTIPTASPLLILISAPSGGGKTTLCQQLLAACPGMTRAVTCTTRSPRTGESDGADYYFLDADSFLKRVQAGNFLEHATDAMSSSTSMCKAPPRFVKKPRPIPSSNARWCRSS